MKVLGLADFVDTARFYISDYGFLEGNRKHYKHIFMDEAEALCLSFEEGIIADTFQTIFRRYELGNAGAGDVTPGCLWFLVDINQASLFLPKHSPQILKSADVTLSKVMRSTATIYRLFKQFYDDPIPRLPPAFKQRTYASIRELSIGHDVEGPPVYWADTGTHSSVLDALVAVIVDLCSAKGVQPNDLCVMPFLVNEVTAAHAINDAIKGLFAEGSFMPQALSNVESFVLTDQPCHFVTPWILRVKGLEFKAVVVVIEDDDFDIADAEDRRKMYIMASRCTCLLVMVSSADVRRTVDSAGVTREYQFSGSLFLEHQVTA
ncbi:hypothetical protein PR048_014477 [Dryococelus australis]|uniref:DNA helicase n=1 Tax=Dryococelus australis TaxID=614101 RepID=A0ABQ9HEH8_9NEOP|nr:hypothetical protein PR048_014477 [Dryococelus australis]